jgi:hypothetical protein
MSSHIVAERLEDMTSRLNGLRDRSGDAEPRPASKPPVAPSAKPPGCKPHDIVIGPNFR